jgi:hypothetical protein
MAAFPFKNELLAPYLTLPQGGKIQAECENLSYAYLISHIFTSAAKMCGLMATVVFVQRLRLVLHAAVAHIVVDSVGSPRL